VVIYLLKKENTLLMLKRIYQIWLIIKAVTDLSTDKLIRKYLICTELFFGLGFDDI